MKRQVGLWIDHTKAIIVIVTGEKEETRRIRSDIGKYIYFSGDSNASPLYGTCNISEKGKQDLAFRSFLRSYYEGVVSLIRHADSVWIFGPGGAKGELEEYLHHDPLKTHIAGIETMDKMTDRQIAAKVRQYNQDNQ